MNNFFDEFYSIFDEKEENILLKYKHSYRVMELSMKYAKLLNYSKEDYELAKFIGLYHDLGRFDQWTKYKTFNDIDSFDHASYACYLLFDYERRWIDFFPFTSYEKELIKYAIYNHNKFEIEKCDDARMIKHAKLIRDTDKIDIFKVFSKYKNPREGTEPISEKVLEAVYNHEVVKFEENSSDSDRLVNDLCLVYDINNDICLDEVEHNLDLFYEKIINKKIYEEVYREVKSYIGKRKVKC